MFIEASLVLSCASLILRAWSLIEEEAVRQRYWFLQCSISWFKCHEQIHADQLRWIQSGAAPVPVSLIEQYAGMDIEIHQIYGLTESCGPACVIGADNALKKVGSTGKAFFHTEVRVVE